jgi:parallel beta-helix repeat protein
LQGRVGRLLSINRRIDMFRILPLLLAAVLLVGPTGAASAAESYDNCTGFIDSLPATISTQGTWCLSKHLSTSMSSGEAITIATNNVTLDCNHFRIGGLAAGTGTLTYGVRADFRMNTTVRNCSIRGFLSGVYFTSGGGHLVENNSFDSNTRYGIWVAGAGSMIRDNIVIDTGGSTTSLGHAFAIFAASGVDVLNNTVSGVAATGTDSHAIGIHTNFNGYGSVNGNRVRGLAPTGTGAHRGIYTSNSEHSIIRDNDVQGPGPSAAGSIGVRCANSQATARNNVVAGFETGIDGCLSSSNAVNSN